MSDDDLIGTTETARRLELSADRVRQLDALLHPVRVSGRRAYRRGDVERVAAERARSTK